MNAAQGRVAFAATVDDAGRRLDVVLHARLPELSRSRIQALIRDGHARLAGRQTLRANAQVTAGAAVELRVPPPQPAEIAAEALPLAVLHEDSHIIVLDKPAGLVVHPAAGHASGTLVNALLHHCRDLAGIGGERRPGIVHRLDRDTSGVMVVAKTEAALNALAAQFHAGAVRKLYLAIVLGVPDPPAGRIETLIGRSARDRKKMSARVAAGRRAVSAYETAERFAGASLLRVRIETGRTHQIRVHLAHVGHPVAGDAQYGSRRRDREAGIEAARQMLHAASLSFRHPADGRALTFEAPPPADFDAALAALRAAAA